MAFDAARNQVVLFGGADVTGFLDDTWLWTYGKLAASLKRPQAFSPEDQRDSG